MSRTRIVSALFAALLCTSTIAAARESESGRDDDSRHSNPALAEARRKFFGVENVDETGRIDKDKVIFSWATNTTYVVAALGHVFVLDSYINRPELPPATGLDMRRTKILPQDFVAMRPEAIFLGHGHGDHADNAAYVAKWTGATIYASAETCDVMQQDVQRMAADPNAINNGAPVIPDGDPVNCVAMVPRGSQPGEYTGTLTNPTGGTTTVRRISQFDPQICVLTFKHVHSGAAPTDPSFTHATFNNIGDPRYDGRNLNTTPNPTVYPAMFPATVPFTPPGNAALRVKGQINTTTTGFGGSAGIIEMWYHFVVRGEGQNFTFAFVNSAGPVQEGIGSGSPGLISAALFNDPVANAPAIALAAEIGKGLFGIMDRLPQTDVLLGSIVSLGATNNQQRDIIMYQQHLRPKVYYPGHVTDVAVPGSAIYHKLSWQQTAFNMWQAKAHGLGNFSPSEWPEFRLQIDPNDFMVPQVFNVKDDRWNKSAAAEDKIRSMCR
jgi:L-ascorbate metabolism protein UlaG (beta-lactamase superfamily)